MSAEKISIVSMRANHGKMHKQWRAPLAKNHMERIVLKQWQRSMTIMAKRSAIVQLNMHDPLEYEIVRYVSQDELEDPAVRAKAIRRFSLKRQPELTDWLKELLHEQTHPLVWRAVVESMLTRPTPYVLSSLHERMGLLTDKETREAIKRYIHVKLYDEYRGDE